MQKKSTYRPGTPVSYSNPASMECTPHRTDTLIWLSGCLCISTRPSFVINCSEARNLIVRSSSSLGIPRHRWWSGLNTNILWTLRSTDVDASFESSKKDAFWKFKIIFERIICIQSFFRRINMDFLIMTRTARMNQFIKTYLNLQRILHISSSLTLKSLKICHCADASQKWSLYWRSVL